MEITDNVSVMRPRRDGGDTQDRRDQPRGAGRADGRPPRAAEVDKGEAKPGEVKLLGEEPAVRDTAA
jgi:hypothetical protein